MTPALAFCLAAALATQAGSARPPAETPPSRARIEMHGRVVLDNFCGRNGLPAVPFDHWRHRAMFTCRVCHVDLGFALGAGETEISAESNEDGAHCGACHDGKRKFQGRTVFRACSGWPRPDPARGCMRCHTGSTDDPRSAYAALAERLPVDAAGDIAWGAAVHRGLLHPVDAVDGVAVHGPTMRIDRDVTLRAKDTWLKSVTFSHRTHAALNGCELCHPEIFPVTERGTTRFRMDDIAAGQYCGVCHRNVAFPLEQCQRCHAEQRQMK